PDPADAPPLRAGRTRRAERLPRGPGAARAVRAATERIARPRRPTRKSSELLDGRVAQHEPLHALGAEVDRRVGVVARAGDRDDGAQPEAVVADPVTDGEGDHRPLLDRPGALAPARRRRTGGAAARREDPR